jgi:hypothetical protein
VQTNPLCRGFDDLSSRPPSIPSGGLVASIDFQALRLIEQGLGLRRAKPSLTRHDDLDALAGTWRKQDASEFEGATALFAKVDAELWK